MAWETQNATEGKKSVKCNGTNYDTSGLSGLGLVEKLKSIARDNGISKFDIFDADNTNLSPADIEAGNFTGDLTITRFNVAA